jgi:Mrp family chromosome partitioning ATPase
MATFIKGEANILFIYKSTAPIGWKPIACLTSNSLATELPSIESQTKCDPGVVVKQAGTFAYTIDAEGQYIDTTSAGGDTGKTSHDALLAIQLTKQNVQWKIDTNVSNQASIKYFGTANISSLNLDAAAGDELMTFSVTLDGSGNILNIDPNV